MYTFSHINDIRQGKRAIEADSVLLEQRPAFVSSDWKRNYVFFLMHFML